jgi:putative oxidoreductase
MHLRLIVTLISIFFIVGCVQKSFKRIVVVKLYVAGIDSIKSVGIRGKGKPLSWNSDVVLNPIVKDSIYTTTFSLVTGYKFVEVKFAVNGELELQNKENRRIVFAEKDTTYYQANYNIQK